MPEIFRPTYKDKHTGQTRTTRYWYAWVHGRRVPLRTTDKKVAERKAVELERAAELGHDPGRLDKARRTPVAAHLADFEESLRAKGCSEAHVGILVGRLRKLFDGCRVATLADATAATVEAWLARRQRDGAISAQTPKHYAVHARQFGRWLAAEGRAARNPFAGLKTNLAVENDRRRRRRALTPEECRRLLAAAAASTRTLGGMAGPDRRVFYLVALTSGLRRNELGSLTPESFRLDATPPTVAVEGARTKNRRAAVLPLRADVAAELRAWLAGKPAGRPLFPVAGRKRKAMLRADLRAAGIEPVADGKVVDLHALRVSFITHLSLGGVPLAVAQKLARHSDPRLTANVYTSLGLADLQQAVEALPRRTAAPPGLGRGRRGDAGLLAAGLSPACCRRDSEWLPVALRVSVRRWPAASPRTAESPASPRFRGPYNGLGRLGGVCTAGAGPGLQNQRHLILKARKRRALRLGPLRCLSPACCPACWVAPADRVLGTSAAARSPSCSRPVPVLSRDCPGRVGALRLAFSGFAVAVPLSRPVRSGRRPGARPSPPLSLGDGSPAAGSNADQRPILFGLSACFDN